MAASQPAEIPHPNAMKNRPSALVDHVSDWRGPHKKPVVVVVQARIILVPRRHDLRGVPGKEEILQIDICQNHLLMPTVECVEPAVRAFLEEMEIGEVVLDAAAVQVAKNAQRGLLIDKQKAAEVRIELLDAGAN